MFFLIYEKLDFKIFKCLLLPKPGIPGMCMPDPEITGLKIRAGIEIPRYKSNKTISTE